MKIVAGEMVSIDGVVEAVTDWGGPFFDEELGSFMDKENAKRDMIIMGRRTYQEMASHWQSQGDATPIAAA